MKILKWFLYSFYKIWELPNLVYGCFIYLFHNFSSSIVGQSFSHGSFCAMCSLVAL